MTKPPGAAGSCDDLKAIIADKMINVRLSDPSILEPTESDGDSYTDNDCTQFAVQINVNVKRELLEMKQRITAVQNTCSEECRRLNTRARVLDKLISQNKPVSEAHSKGNSNSAGHKSTIPSRQHMLTNNVMSSSMEPMKPSGQTLANASMAASRSLPTRISKRKLQEMEKNPEPETLVSERKSPKHQLSDSNLESYKTYVQSNVRVVADTSVELYGELERGVHGPYVEKLAHGEQTHSQTKQVVNFKNFMNMRHSFWVSVCDKWHSDEPPTLGEFIFWMIRLEYPAWNWGDVITAHTVKDNNGCLTLAKDVVTRLCYLPERMLDEPITPDKIEMLTIMLKCKRGDYSKITG